MTYKSIFHSTQRSKTQKHIDLRDKVVANNNSITDLKDESDLCDPVKAVTVVGTMCMRRALSFCLLSMPKVLEMLLLIQLVHHDNQNKFS